MPRVSVVICCANASETLPAALESSKWADEIIVVDSGSTDATAQIAQRFATRYVFEPWRGYTGQKQFGASLARNDWVFVLDGDEEITPDLAREIQSLTDADLEKLDVLWMRRRNYVMGRYVRAWGPDWQSRLIHRERCRWNDEVLHDDRLPSHPSRQRYLTGQLEHKRTSKGDFKDYFNGRLEDSRMLLVARQMYARGKRCRRFDLVIRPWSAFVKIYFVKLAILDGLFGWMIAQKAARGVQLKYAALWAVQNGIEPAEDKAKPRNA